MNTAKQLAKQFREVHFGGNWTDVNLKDSLQGITWQQATAKIDNLNTIAALVFHVNYYVDAVLKVFRGETLQASDKYAFSLKPINSEDDWQQLVSKLFSDAEQFCTELEQLDENKLFETFEDPKYGNYFRNIAGVIEHTHYHLGQIVLLKKLTAK